MINIETHCHSCYSHDCGLQISDIVNRCAELGINGIVICDHDTCGITDEDEALFRVNDIDLYKAIEFTTAEGIHIIGVSDKIKGMEKEQGFYSALVLVEKLKQEGAAVIIPHPFHETGIIGNKTLSENDIGCIFRNADFIECQNYKYFSSADLQPILNKYSNLVPIVGSDAHARRDVGALYNTVVCRERIMDLGRLDDVLKKDVVSCHRRKKNNAYRIIIRKIKMTLIYQTIITMIPADMRRKLKNKYINR